MVTILSPLQVNHEHLFLLTRVLHNGSGLVMRTIGLEYITLTKYLLHPVYNYTTSLQVVMSEFPKVCKYSSTQAISPQCLNVFTSNLI